VLESYGRVPGAEMDKTFNQGVGMAAVVASSDADTALRLLASRGLDAWPLGEVVPGSGTVRFA
ncbi:MAG: AIR synthase-related protein, partial [Actinoallomurus sp.]